MNRFALFLLAVVVRADSVWVELAPEGKQIVRAIREAPGAACPSIRFAGKTAPMQVRVKPQGSLNVLICEAILPTGTSSARVDGRPVPLLGKNVRKVLIIGDTGCRLVERGKASEFQDCSNPDDWEFPRTAAAGAKLKPDLIVHVGDYLYRESACPEKMGCKGTPVGNGWPGWKADFFDPAAPLLRAAPWIFVRGNHEDCNRAWDGWFRFLHPGPMPAANCEGHSKPYSVKAGDFQFAVIDSTIGNDDVPKPSDVAMFEQDFAAIAAMRLSKAWLLTHRPIWGLRQRSDGLVSGSVTLQRAWLHEPALGIAGIVAGHIHAMEWIDFGPKRPVQLVVGNSGTSTLEEFNAPATDFQVDGMRVESATVRFGKGYALMKGTGSEVKVEMHAGRDEQNLACKVNIVANCAKVK